MELLNAGVHIHGKNMVSYVASSFVTHCVINKNRAWKFFIVK